jgi:sugar lactone lactonase YvrE
MKKQFVIVVLAIALTACGKTPGDARSAVAPSSPIVVNGLSGPESVRYDAELDLYFVSNFNGEPEGDANGFVSKVSADGEILELKFMEGSDRWPFHGGRGMWLDEDGLWVVDAGGLHLFDRITGEQLDFIDFSGFELGFLNDVVRARDGALYVTDTGTSSLYRIDAGVVSLVTKVAMNPNGIALNPANGRLLLVPWSGGNEILEWDIDAESMTATGAFNGGGNFDGIEVVNGKIIVSSQEDTSLHFMVDGVDNRAIDLPGKPADIGIDTKRNRVAVPYVALNRVDILPLGD